MQLLGPLLFEGSFALGRFIAVVGPDFGGDTGLLVHLLFPLFHGHTHN